MSGRTRLGQPVIDTFGQRRVERARWTTIVLALVLLGLVTGVAAYLTAPKAFSLALLGIVFVCVAAFVRPAVGVYSIVFFSLVGDSETTNWWPFTKNLSMRESIFFVHDSLPITPLELVLAAAWGAFLLRSLVDHEWHFRRGRVLAPVAVFGLFVLGGIARGALTGYDRNVALFEFRPLLYLVAVYALIPNVLVTRLQYRIAFALALIATSLQSLFSLSYYRSLSSADRELLETLSEHSAAITMNLVFVFLIGLLAFDAQRWLRRSVAVIAVPVVFAYFLSQRRAAVVALIVGLLALAAVLLFRDGRRFSKFVPGLAAGLVLFVIATWNASGALGLPATAVKTVLFPGSLTATDQASNDYRDIENYNLWFTIQSSPLLGKGFGKTFTIARPMPDISFFAMWQYFSHNSVLWIWIKTGFFGFVTMLFMFARVIQRGAHAALRLLRPADVAMVVAAFAYLMMFLTFAYVDIAFGIRPVVVLALCFAICADFEWAEAPTPPSRLVAPLDVPEPARIAA